MRVDDSILMHAKLRFELENADTPRCQELKKTGRLLVRQRISAFFDEGTFVEIGAYVKKRPTEFDGKDFSPETEGVVTGYGLVGGRPIFAYFQDMANLSGSVGEMHAKKIVNIYKMAEKSGAPVIGVLDSDGAKIADGIDALNGYGEIFQIANNLSGVVPQISVVLGSCAGAMAFIAKMSDVVIISEKQGSIFLNSPYVIDAKFEKPQGTGTPEAALKSGIAMLSGADDVDCLVKAKEVLEFLPSNNIEMPIYPFCDNDDINRAIDYSNFPDSDATGYDILPIISSISDNGEFLELSKLFAENMITGFIRLNGIPVGVISNQPNEKDGMLNGAATLKAAGFMRFCDSFNIPVVTFVDTPGFEVSTTEELTGANLSGASLIHAYAEATTPKITVILRKAYGSSYLTMGAKSCGADIVMAWSTAIISSMEPSLAVAFLQNEKLRDFEDPIAGRIELIEKYKSEFASPYQAARHGQIDDIILPGETRSLLISHLELLMSKKESKPSKKHSNMPV